MNNLVGELSDDEDFLELINVIEHPRRPMVFRDRPNQFEKWNETDFIKRFRLTKDYVHFVINRIAHLIESPTDRNQAVTPTEMIFVTLRYYATGRFLQVSGDFVGIDKSTASRIIYKVSRAIAGLQREFIKMPVTNQQMDAVSEEFYNISRFPRCIGALDCTHVKISSPGGDEPEIYRNRKEFFSFNVQAICDANLRFQNIVCRWPGSSHDSHIFRNSSVRVKFENGEYGNKLLVGDSGYGIRSYLITPLRNPATQAENRFNESQIRTRNPVERCFGVWKRILAFGIRLKTNKVEAIVISTAVLHNIASLHNDPMPPVNDEENAAVQFVENMPAVEQVPRMGANNNSIRLQLINDYFRVLQPVHM